MRVYLVTEWAAYEPDKIHGVFSSVEIAQAVAGSIDPGQAVIADPDAPGGKRWGHIWEGGEIAGVTIGEFLLDEGMGGDE